MRLTITFYEVAKCGLYEKTKGPKAPKFSSLGDFLSSLEKMCLGNGKEPCRLEDTKVFEHSQETGENTVLIHNIKSTKDKKRWLLTTWNEVAMSKAGKIASINPQDKVGESQAQADNVKRGNIPGYASYYYFIPEKNLYATVQFNKILNGNPGLRRYALEYMHKFSPYTVSEKVTNDDGTVNLIIKGFRANPKDDQEPLQNLDPEFEFIRGERAAHIAEIKKNREIIVKIVRKNKLSLLHPEAISLNDKIMDTLFAALKKITSKTEKEEKTVKKIAIGAKVDMPIMLEIKHSPTEAQLNDIISKWEANHAENTFWDNVGFVYENESTKIHWLDFAIQKEDFDFSLKDEIILNSDALLTQLFEREESIAKECGVRRIKPTKA